MGKKEMEMIKALGMNIERFAGKVLRVGKPLTVELLESCLTGARECKFAIHL